MARGSIQLQDMAVAWVVHRKETRNIGDRLLGNGLESALTRLGCQVKRFEYGATSVFIRAPLGRLRIIGLYNFCRAIARGILGFRARPDVVIIGGGQLLLPNGYFLYSGLGWSLAAKMLGAKVALFAVGTEERGKQFGLVDRSLLVLILHLADSVHVRDELSRELLSRFTAKHRLDLVPDPAYMLEFDETAIESKDYVGVCVASFKGVKKYGLFETVEEYYDAYLYAIERELRYGDTVCIFSTVCGDSKTISEFRLYLQSRYSDIIVLEREVFGESQLIKVIAESRVVIGARLHALIFAHILGRQIVPIIGKNKIAAAAAVLFSRNPADLRKELLQTLSEVLDSLKNCEREQGI